MSSPNPNNLQDATQRLLNLIFSTGVPGPIRQVMASLKREILSAFPNNRLKVINNLFFWRFICPAVLIPEEFGLLQAPPNSEQRRALLLVSKVIQHAVNEKPFGPDEELLIPLNSLIAQNKGRFEQHITLLTNYPTDEDNTSSYPQYRDMEKNQYMSLVIKHLHNNFATLNTSLSKKSICCRSQSQVVLHGSNDNI